MALEMLFALEELQNQCLVFKCFYFGTHQTLMCDTLIRLSCTVKLTKQKLTEYDAHTALRFYFAQKKKNRIGELVEKVILLGGRKRARPRIGYKHLVSLKNAAIRFFDAGKATMTIV